MIDKDVRIDNVSFPISDLQLVLTKDATLDFGRFLINRSTQQDKFTMFDDCVIILDDGIDIKEFDGYVIESDRVTPENIKTKTLWKHEITIIERTAKLDNYVVPQRIFNQTQSGTRRSVFDNLDILNQTTPTEQAEFVDTTRVLEFGSSITDLSDIEAPEFQSVKKTYREAINEQLDEVEGVARLTRKALSPTSPTTYPHNVLEVDLFNATGVIRDKDSNDFYEDTQNINQYSTKVDVTASNLVNEKVAGGAVYEPSLTGFSNLRGDGGVLENATAFYEIKYPKLQKFQIKMNVPTQTLGDKEIDVTPYVLEQQEIVRLELTNAAPQLYEGNYQANSIVWDSRQQRITDWYKEYDKFGLDIGKTVAIDNVIKSGLTDLLGDSTDAENEFVAQDSWELEVRIVYRGFYNSRLQVERIDGDNSDINKVSNRIINQNDKAVSVNRLMKKLFTDLQQSGLPEYRSTTQFTTLQGIFDLGDFTSGGYIITKIELIFGRNSFNAKYEWTKNYQKRSDRIAVNSLPQLYNIPNDDRTVERNDYYSEYMIVTFDNITEDSTSSLSDRGLEVFMNTFVRASEDDKPPFFAIFRSSDIVKNFEPDGSEVPISSTDAIEIPLQTNGDGNALNFYFEFQSQNLAGQQITIETIGGVVNTRVLRAVQYVDGNGELDTFFVKYVNNYIISDKDQLPYMKTFNVLEEIILNKEYKVLKNSGDIYRLSWGLQIIPEYEDDIIIGDEMVKRNNLVEAEVSQNLFLIKGDGRYDRFETQLGKTGSISGGSFTVSTPTAGGLINVPVISSDNWAIVDEDNKLYVAVNQLQKDGSFNQRTVLWFKRKRKRDDIIDLY